MECWTSPRPLVNDCEAGVYFNFLLFQNTLTSGQPGPLIYGEVSERRGCPVIRNPRAGRRFGCIAQGCLSSTQEVNWQLSRYLSSAKLLPRRSYCRPSRSTLQKNQWSRWCKTLNILCFYCFHLSTNLKELWDIPIYLFLYSQRQIFLGIRVVVTMVSA